MQTQKQPSLAESLRQRRQFLEHMDQERAIRGKKSHTRQVSEYIQNKTPNQTDESGTAIRFRNQRPQTPRINLLKAGRQAYQSEQPANHPLFSEQAQLRKKPFNNLNPNAKIGIDTLYNKQPLQLIQP